jgi:putative membrane protein
VNRPKQGSDFVRPARHVSSVIASLGLVAVLPSAAFAADSDGVEVVNTETVQVYMDAEGAVDSSRVYEQLTLTGQGSVELNNPIEDSGLRNLDGFAGYDTVNGTQVVSADVDGVERLRTVSDFTGQLPLEVSVTYLLDGQEVEPNDVVGADGDLEVRYTVKNVTGVEQTVSFPDGSGGLTTETVFVPVPIVGSLSTVAPPSFTNVQSQQANIAGDGKGGTKLSFTMTLFPPIGSDTVEFGYTATINDGVVPGASVSALPVNPLQSPSFKTAGDSYKSGSATGLQLAMGASTIDENLLKLRDGSADLLSGLLLLSDGADELNAGLSGEAAPGAAKLASGALQLDDGLGQLDAGAGQLAAGAQRLRLGIGQLDDGAGKLAKGGRDLKDGAVQLRDGAGELSKGTGAAVTGSEKLEEGLKLISGGLNTLADQKTGLPTAVAGVDALKAGVNEILAGFGSTTQDGTLLFGLQSLETGLAQLEGGAQALQGGLVQLRGDGSPTTPGLVAAKGGVDQVKSGLDSALAPANGPAEGGGLAELRLGIQSLTAYCDIDEVACQPTIDQLVAGVDDSRSDLTAASTGLGQVSAGLGTAIEGLNTQLIPGAQQIVGGLTAAKNGAIKTKAGAVALRGGVTQVGGGLDQLKTGLATAVAGVLQLNTGAGTAYTGAGSLNDGLVQIDDGAGQLATGAGKLAAGTKKLSAGANELKVGTGKLRTGSGELADGADQLADGTGEAKAGTSQLADGADQLSDGLGAAADGSGQLADGLDQAAAGAPKIVQGAGRLSDEGMSMLIAAGKDTAQDYGKLYAIMEAGATLADVQDMAYGAPEGAQGLTAYSYELVGEDGETGRNATRGIVALVLLGLGLTALGLRRRFA